MFDRGTKRPTYEQEIRRIGSVHIPDSPHFLHGLPDWTSQRVATTRARWRASTALRLIGVLDVLQEYVSALKSARAFSSHALEPLSVAIIRVVLYWYHYGTTGTSP